jgi:hypothetical protein
MNGWNGLGIRPLPGIAGLTGAVGPLSGGAPANTGYPIAAPAIAPSVMAPSLVDGLGFGSPTAGDMKLGSAFGAGNGLGGGSGGWFGIDGLGRNLDTLKLGIGTVGAVAGLWNGLQQNKLARQSFQHQKGILDTNLANQIKAYNMSIDDKFRSRAVVEGMSDAERDAAIERNRARDERRG